MADIRRERHAIPVDERDHPGLHLLELVFPYELLERDDQGRIADDPKLVAFPAGELGEGAQAVLALGLGPRLVEIPGLLAGDLGPVSLERVEVEPLVPNVEAALGGKAA